MRIVKLPNADDPILRRINGLRTLLGVLGGVPVGGPRSDRLSGEIREPEGNQRPPSFAEMMAVVNRRGKP
ncbi:MAG: hypothetical protein ACYDD0_00895 [Candidatus Dormibacteria bacterium]